MKQLTLASLANMDRDRVGHVLQKHLNSVQNDCRNRPCDATGKAHARLVTIEIELTPELEIDEIGPPELCGMNAEIRIKSKLPVDRSNTVRMAVTETGMFFSPIDNKNPNARDLFEEAAETEETDQ